MKQVSREIWSKDAVPRWMMNVQPHMKSHIEVSSELLTRDTEGNIYPPASIMPPVQGLTQRALIPSRFQVHIHPRIAEQSPSGVQWSRETQGQEAAELSATRLYLHSVVATAMARKNVCMREKRQTKNLWNIGSHSYGKGTRIIFSKQSKCPKT